MLSSIQKSPCSSHKRPRQQKALILFVSNQEFPVKDQRKINLFSCLKLGSLARCRYETRLRVFWFRVLNIFRSDSLLLAQSLAELDSFLAAARFLLNMFRTRNLYTLTLVSRTNSPENLAFNQLNRTYYSLLLYKTTHILSRKNLPYSVHSNFPSSP